MKILDFENWERKNHYNHFKDFDCPHVGLCANIDITEFYGFIKEKNLPFFISFLYIASKAANDIKEFRYRIRESNIVEHDIVSPAFTLMTYQNLFSFCTSEFVNDYDEFLIKTSEKIEESKKIVDLTDEPGRDDLLFITSVPWVSFTSITHPMNMNPVDSIPRIAWGKFFEEDGRIKLPLSVQAHHGLVDGAHIGQYFTLIQEILDSPERYLICNQA